MSNYSKTTDFEAKDSLPTGDSGKIIRGAEFETEFDAISTAIATKADTAGPTFTGTLTFETISDGTIGVTAFVDEDNMASNSATLVPTQQSVKAYVDSQVTAQDLDFQADTGGALSIDLDSETMTFTGGTGIDTSGLGNAVTFAIDSTVATLTGTQTLTNKTLTSPDVNTPDIDGGTIDGTVIGGTTPAAVSATTVSATGNITVGGTVDGRDVATDGTKLDGIEASADVTDTTNVTAAGALMDSELTSEASVKALNQGVATTDSPTFAAVTVNGNVEFDGLSGTGSVTVTDILDQDDMSSNSATALATQQSIKAYVDTTVAATNELVEDTTPQLGGDLDLNSNDITGTGNINNTGTITTDGLTVDGAATITTADNSTQLTLVSTDADSAVGPVLDLFRNSASPGNFDLLGKVLFSGEDSAGNKTEYAHLQAYPQTVTNGAESGYFEIHSMVGGTDRVRIEANATEVVINQPGIDSDFRVESDGNTHALFVDAGNNRVGIFNSSPATALDVTGTITTDGLTVDSTASFSYLPVSTAGSVVGAIGTGSSVIFNTPSVNTSYGSGLAIDGSYASDLSSVNIKAFGPKFSSYGSELNLFTSDDTSLLKRQTIASNGDISFYEDTGTTAKLFWDASAEKLGIGTSSPDRQLSVNSFSGNGTVSINASTTGASTLYFADGNTGTNIYTGFIQYSHSNNAMQFATNGGTERMRINSSGNVNIGSTNSGVSGSLDVSIGSTSSTGGITLWSPTNGTHSLGFGDGYTGTDRYRGYVEYAHGDDSMRLATASTERMRIDSTGIDVTGSISADGLTVDGDATISDTTPSLLLMESDTTDVNTRFLNNGGDFFLSTINDAKSSVKNRFSLDHATGDISFYEDTGTTAKLFWDASAESLGIGTSSPAAPLDVAYADNANIFRASYASSEDNFFLELDSSILTGGVIGYQFHLKNNGTSYNNMLTFDRGNVGIGTSSPSKTLDIEGNIRAKNTAGSSGAEIDITSGGTWRFRSNATTGTNSYGLDIVKGSAGTDVKMSINSSGNVGIGTSSPAGALHIHGGSYGEQFISSSNSAMRFVSTGGVNYIQSGTATSSSSAADLIFTNVGGSGETMRIDANGNLLVGDSSATFNDTAKTVIRPSSDNWVIKPTVCTSFNRTASDGDILEFYRGSSSKVGSIGADGGDMYLGTGITGVIFNDVNNAILPYRTNAEDDANISLGLSSFRFKDLYLSGRSYSVGITNYTNALRLESLDTSVNATESIGDIEFASNDASSGGAGVQAKISAVADNSFGTAYALAFQTGSSASPSERMRIDSSGNLLVGKSSTSGATVGHAIKANGQLESVVDGSYVSYLNRKTSAGTISLFALDGAQVGSISVTSSATAYNTSSDQRLKDNIVNAPSASDDIDAIQVRSFDWKADGSHQKYGMVAQELQSVAPEAVSGDADSDDMMGVDYSKLVPMMLKEIQSLRARVAQLEGVN